MLCAYKQDLRNVTLLSSSLYATPAPLFAQSDCTCPPMGQKWEAHGCGRTPFVWPQIKMKVKKTRKDKELASNRHDLLKYLNSSYE